MRFRNPVFAILMLAAPFTLSGQERGGGRPIVGLIGGLNLAKLAGEEITGEENRVGFLVGAFATWRLSSMFALQPEVHYTQKGVKFSGDEEGFPFEAAIKLDYVEVPLLLRATFPASQQSVRFHVLAGPAFAFKASCRIRLEGDGIEVEDDCEDDDSTTGPIKSFDYGAMLGGGVDFRIGGRTLVLGARYNLGLANLSDDEDVKNRVLSLVLGIGF